MEALNVLIIEDDAMVGMLLTEILQDLGHDVCGTSVTEDDAVAVAARHRPDLLIVDKHLREGTGAGAVERILLTGPVRCVFISRGPVNLDKRGQTVLRKPFSVQDLVRAIENAAGQVHTPQADVMVGDGFIPDHQNPSPDPVNTRSHR